MHARGSVARLAALFASVVGAVLSPAGLGGCGGQVGAGGNGSNAGDTGDASTNSGDAAGSTGASDGGIETISPVPTPTHNAGTLASDGTTLYWTDFVTNNLSSMPVGGGTPSTVITGMFAPGFLVADTTDVYFLNGGVLQRLPKGSSTPIAISDPSVAVSAVTVLEGSAYWVETGMSTGPMTPVTIRSATLPSGPVSVVAQYNGGPGGVRRIAVTNDTVFLMGSTRLESFPRATGVPAGGMPQAVAGGALGSCEQLVSDTDAVYCIGSKPLTRIASDGTTTPLAKSGQPFSVAVDAAYIYYVDNGAGAVLKIAKQGNATVTISNDPHPVAITVDNGYVYWSDNAGNIMRAAK